MANSHSTVDLSHHLSDRALNVKPSPLKSMYKYLGVPGIIGLAGTYGFAAMTRRNIVLNRLRSLSQEVKMLSSLRAANRSQL